MNNFQSWQSVKVINQALESCGRAGRVTSATEYKKGKAMVVDVQLDGDDAEQITTFDVADISIIGA